VTAPALLHPGNQLAGKADRRLEVDAQDAAELILAEVVEPPGPRQARVGDQAVDDTRLRRERLPRAVLGEVRDGGPMTAAGQRGRELLEGLPLARAQDEGRAVTRERGRDRAAQTAGRAAQKHGLAGKLHSDANLPHSHFAAIVSVL
jgi:hypothetical protein